MNVIKSLMAASVTLLVLAGCQAAEPVANMEAAAPPAEVTVPIAGGAGQMLGTAKLSPWAEGGVRIRIQVAGLKPGLHGFHIHEKPLCEGPDFTSAGSHFNPGHKQHGFENPKGAHAGDLPNLVVNEQGAAQADFITKAVVLDKGKPNSLYTGGGTSLVIHEQPDDLKTDPAGNSGKRIACGVVK
ncbi:superoxide dismutase family protein [Paenibacillus athensensis]|uniref:Superoxide dismutase [Cu-Zn] n=1 Tax=Paenibacillus athensensis TaxID=1967502 RepID=A0A4Y8PVU5_9BACL|nr:superoxide dismutase family protein [Paenibacillus athensensis]MCD1257992.1 superoxide dismutase family protein [Paenibacillus athensensis]